MRMNKWMDEWMSDWIIIIIIINNDLEISWSARVAKS